MRILYLEPFDSGSHAAFGRALTGGIAADWTTLTLPGRFWKWRMRGAAVQWSLEHGEALRAPHDLVVASSYLPLAELRGLEPALATVPAVLYFHENQLAYPRRAFHEPTRDHHFAFTQMASCLAAERCVFNSRYNLESFQDGARDLLRRMPDEAPRRWIETIAERSTVLGLPLDLPDVEPAALADVPAGDARRGGPLILWNHRWEHDKNPSAFFAALRHLDARGVAFRVAVCGQRYREAPPEFEAARSWLGDRVIHWGHTERRADYERILGTCQLAISTATHEFFGVSMLEATHFGACPVVPDRLAYRELYPAEYSYPDDDALGELLEPLCRSWTAGDTDLRADRRALTADHRAAVVLPEFERLFRAVAVGGRLTP